MKTQNYPGLARASWRRALTRLALAAGVATPALAQAQVQAVPADRLLETIGVGTRFDWKYDNDQGTQTKQALEGIGFRYLRLGVSAELYKPNKNWSGYQQYWSSYASQKGLKLVLTCEGDESKDDLSNKVNTWTQTSGLIWGLEGANETYGRSNWSSDFANSFELQKYLYSIGQPLGLKVLTWTAGGGANAYRSWPNPDAYCTHANFHAYSWDTSADNGKQIIPIWQDRSLNDAGFTDKGGLWEMEQWTGNSSKPKTITEWGFTWEAQGDGSYQNVDSELSRAKYVLRNSLELLNAKVDKAFYYSLVDENDKFGIANLDGTLKQSGQGLANLFALLRDPGHANDNAGSLNYSLSVASGMSTTDDHRHQTNEIHQSLLQKSNGHFVLALWVDEPSHTGSTGSQNATLTLNGVTASEVKIYLPLTNGTTAVQTLGAGTQSVSLSGNVAIPDHPLLVEITPTGTTSTAAFFADGVYTLTSKLAPSNGGASQRLDVLNGTDANGQQVGLWDQNNLTPQNWYFHHVGNNVYAITSEVGAKNKQLDADNTGGIKQGSKVQLYGSGQRWLLESAGNGYYYLTPEAVMTQSPKLRLDVGGNKSARGTYGTVQLWTDNGVDGQKWKIEPVALPTGTYTLGAQVSSASGAAPTRVLDVAAADNSAGRRLPVINAQQAGKATQQWAITRQSDGYYTITTQLNGSTRILDAVGSGTAKGTEVQLYWGNNSAAQSFKIEADGTSGYYFLTPKYMFTGSSVPAKPLRLDVRGGTNADGTQVWLWEDNGLAPQRWKIDAVSGGTAARAAANPSVAPAEAETAPALRLYPNPSPDGRATLVLTADQDQTATVQVRNAQGKLVATFAVPAQAGQTEVKLPAALGKGTYFVQAKLDGKTQRFALQVE